jgi:hypothetical protein
LRLDNPLLESYAAIKFNLEFTLMFVAEGVVMLGGAQ